MGWRGFGFVHHSRTIFCRAVPNLSITIRNFFIAVHLLARLGHCGRNCRSRCLERLDRGSGRHGLGCCWDGSGSRLGLGSGDGLGRGGRRRFEHVRLVFGRRRDHRHLAHHLCITGLLWDVSTLCALAPPPGLYGVVGTGLLWDVSTLCAVAPPPGLYGGVVSSSSTLLSLVEVKDDGSYAKPFVCVS
jgi:hypothetical protein